jgi:hypothetical protein
MTRFRKLEQLKRLVPGAATVLTLSLAVTLRVEHSCSDGAPQKPAQVPAVLYTYPEFLAAAFAAPEFCRSCTPELLSPARWRDVTLMNRNWTVRTLRSASPAVGREQQTQTSDH